MKFSNVSGLLFLGGTYDDVAVHEQANVQQYNILNFLGGSSPYFQTNAFGISTDIPESCTLEQVQFVGRHGERFPTVNKDKKMRAVVEKLQHQNLNGSLAFINDYEYFVTDDRYLAQETTEENCDSIFAGSLSAERDGKTFRAKYGSLYNADTVLPVFTSNSQRVYDTCRNFLKGFFNGTEPDTDEVKINVIAESNSTANSLTPKSACANFEKDFETPEPLEKYATSFISRMQTGDNPNLDLEKGDVQYLFDICAFEINVKGSSQFCGIFTNEEFIRYEYYADVKAYYNFGAANEYAPTIGSVMLDASLKLLKEENDNKVWLSFTHDNDILVYLTGIGLFNDGDDLDLEEVQFDRTFRRANIVPQSARVILEKLKCGGKHYVRFIINDAVIPLECSYGPGFSCSLQDYIEFTKENAGKSFNEKCGTDFAANDTAISFYWDYDAVDYNATLKSQPLSD